MRGLFIYHSISPYKSSLLLQFEIPCFYAKRSSAKETVKFHLTEWHGCRHYRHHNHLFRQSDQIAEYLSAHQIKSYMRNNAVHQLTTFASDLDLDLDHFAPNISHDKQYTSPMYHRITLSVYRTLFCPGLPGLTWTHLSANKVLGELMLLLAIQ